MEISLPPYKAFVDGIVDGSIIHGIPNNGELTL
jgi:hypothetical protein